MKKIIILGNSIVGVKAIETIRAVDKESEIALWPFDTAYPIRRELIGEFLSQAINEEKFLYRPVQFYKDQKVQMVMEKNISRVNFKKKKIVPEEGASLDYDVLILTDTPDTRFPDVKGVKREGVFGLRKFSDLEGIRKLAPLSENIIIEAASPLDLIVARALKSANREVIIIYPQDHLFSDFLSLDAARLIEEILSGQGIRFIANNTIAEVMGEADVKALRLKTGKVLACELLIFGNASPSFRLFTDSDLEIVQKIRVDDSFKTNMDNVYALNDLFRSESLKSVFEWNHEDLEEQGKSIGSGITGQSYSPVWAGKNSYADKDLSLSVLGYPARTQGFKSCQTTDKEKKVYRDIVADNGIIVGSVLLNAAQDEERIRQMISAKAEVGNWAVAVLEESLDYHQLLERLKEQIPAASNHSGTGQGL